jgi:hypothetical protein
MSQVQETQVPEHDDVLLLVLWNGCLSYKPSLLRINKRVRHAALHHFKTEFVIHQAVQRGFLDTEMSVRAISKPIHDFCGGLKLNFMDDTALMAACSYRQASAAPSLICRRVTDLLSIPSYRNSLSMQSIYGYTALHCACMHYPVEIGMVGALLDATADPNARTLTVGVVPNR